MDKGDDKVQGNGSGESRPPPLESHQSQNDSLPTDGNGGRLLKKAGGRPNPNPARGGTARKIHFHDDRKDRKQAPQVRPNFPVALWSEVGKWLSKLTWSGRSENHGALGRHSHEVTWLGVVIGFEFTAGILCMRDESEPPSWGQRSVLLKSIAKQVRG